MPKYYKITIKRRIITISRTREIGENIKIIIKINIGINHEISMIVIDLMIQMILIIERGHMTETNHTKETIHIVEIGLIVEIDCEAIIKISETRDIKEGIETIVKTSVKMGT